MCPKSVGPWVHKVIPPWSVLRREVKSLSLQWSLKFLYKFFHQGIKIKISLTSYQNFLSRPKSNYLVTLLPLIFGPLLEGPKESTFFGRPKFFQNLSITLKQKRNNFIYRRWPKIKGGRKLKGVRQIFPQPMNGLSQGLFYLYGNPQRKRIANFCNGRMQRR